MLPSRFKNLPLYIVEIRALCVRRFPSQCKLINRTNVSVKFSSRMRNRELDGVFTDDFTSGGSVTEILKDSNLQVFNQ